MISRLPLSAMPDNAASAPGNHAFIVRAHDADVDPAGSRENDVRIGHIVTFVEFDSKRTQTLAYARSYRGSVLTNACGEDQRVHAAARRGEGADRPA
jgi:hypothetical protein